MNKLTCSHPDSAVIDSRPSGNTIRRRRKCLTCSARWSTIEVSTSQYDQLVNGISKVEKIARKACGLLVIAKGTA